MRNVPSLSVSDQLRSFPSLFREVLSISHHRSQKRSKVKEYETWTLHVADKNGGNRAGVAVPIQKPKRKNSADNLAERLIGRTISHYRILAKLGTGGMSIIYRAQDVRLSRQVAVKFASEEFQTNAAFRECFRSEARAASALNHPNICRVYDVGEFADRPFLVMELLEGRTLRKLIEVPLALGVFLDLSIQIADGLHAVHASGIVHGDITSSNIHVSSTGCAKIFDFGLAEFSIAPAKHRFSTVERLFQRVIAPGRAWGTLPYMSPEQIRGESLEARTDLFSLGVVLYEMLTGERPFQGSSPAAVLDAIIRRPFVPVSALRPDVPEMLEKVIEKALEKDRQYRCQSAAELQADLKRIQRDLDLHRGKRGNGLSDPLPY